jgi:hypothetical protein
MMRELVSLLAPLMAVCGDNPFTHSVSFGNIF